mmetsp:Transcript_24891/g.81957  ORF Transcript_24891/g.81957 Transcript_24891/m.81957 type:complete len:410 (+) Transcript_24891:207-1436(+)
MKMQPSEFRKDSSLFDKVILEEEEGLGLRIGTASSEINTRSTGNASRHQVVRPSEPGSVHDRPQTTHFHKGRSDTNSNVTRRNQVKDITKQSDITELQARNTPRQNSCTSRKHNIPSLCIPAPISASSTRSNTGVRSVSSARNDQGLRIPLKPKPPYEDGVRCTPRPGIEFNEQMTFRIMERLHTRLRSSPLACSARPWTSSSKKKSQRAQASPPADHDKDSEHKLFDNGENIERPRCKRPAWNNSTLNTLFNPRKIDISPRKWQLMNGAKRPATTNIRVNAVTMKDNETMEKMVVESKTNQKIVDGNVDAKQSLGAERRLMIPPLPFCPTDLQQLERPETRRGLSSSSRSSLWSREFAELQTGVTEKMNLGPAFMSGREFEPLYTEGEQKRLLSDMGYGNWILQKRIV